MYLIIVDIRHKTHVLDIRSKSGVITNPDPMFGCCLSPPVEGGPEVVHHWELEAGVS